MDIPGKAGCVRVKLTESVDPAVVGDPSVDVLELLPRVIVPLQSLLTV